MQISKLKRLGLCAMCENRHKSHFIDKIVRDVKKLLCQTVVLVLLFCEKGVRFPKAISK